MGQSKIEKLNFRGEMLALIKTLIEFKKGQKSLQEPKKGES
jgi:hypothetical protein